MIMSNSTISGVMNMIKSKFSSMTFWQRIEGDIAIMCADLPEPTSIEKKLDFINRLENIKGFLLREEVRNKDLEFLDDEISLYKSTEVLGIYKDAKNDIDPMITSAYARISKGKEGVSSITQPFNYEQLTKLSNGVFNINGEANFYISTEKTIYGKIIAEYYEGHPQEIPVAIIVEGKKDKDTGECPRSIKLFGQQIDKTKFKTIKEIVLPFYFYRFITEDNKDMMLVSMERQEIGDYVTTGMETKCNDFKSLTDSTRILTKLPFFFVQNIRNRIISFDNHDQFKKRIKQLDVRKETLFEYPFTTERGDKAWKLLQPKWYKWLIWSWLTHEKKGMMNTYPMHLMILGEAASGKSVLLNSLHKKTNETKNIFAGASSTLKSLVPSFKNNPAQIGYLAESNRFALCDEFLRCLVSNRTTQEGSSKEESVGIMNDLLEHQKREVGSGVSKANVNMTARILAMSNPVRGVSNMNNLLNGYDESFLSRWLIYYQTDDHVQMIKRSNDSDLKLYDYKINNNDFISIIDYLQSFPAKYDLKKMEDVYNGITKTLSENVAKHYRTRHKHHMECLLDGIIKTRCLMENDIKFEANDEDYKILKEVWSNIIRSWLNVRQIKNIDINERIFYIQEDAQYLYWKIFNEKDIVSKNQCIQFGFAGDMDKEEFDEAFSILINMELIVESNGAVRTHNMGLYEDENQKKIFGGK
jgi:hypothetical protein